MPKRQPVSGRPVPRLILLSDARNDAGLERAVARLPRGSALVFRHYHCASEERLRRLATLRRLCRLHGVALILAGTEAEARSVRAAGAYAAPARLGPRRGGLRLATAHSLREIRQAVAAGADAVLLSPVFATRSHPGGAVLGPLRFLFLAARSPVPVLALGGLTRARAERLRADGKLHGWAAIDGLSR